MPRLIVPSNGGGTKLIRTLLAGEAEGVCAGTGAGVGGSSGEMEWERDSSTVGEGIGVGDSCAKATDARTIISNAKVSLVVMSSEVETSLIFLKNVERFLDFARNDKS
jgi:hypothetical protein